MTPKKQKKVDWEERMKEAEHIEAQEHFGECPKCQKIQRNFLRKEVERVLGEVREEFEEWASGDWIRHDATDRFLKILQQKIAEIKKSYENSLL